MEKGDIVTHGNMSDSFFEVVAVLDNFVVVNSMGHNDSLKYRISSLKKVGGNLSKKQAIEIVAYDLEVSALNEFCIYLVAL